MNGQNTILDADPITSYSTLTTETKGGKKELQTTYIPNKHSYVYLYFTPLIHDVVAQIIGV